jgi:hypothetical protein
MLAGVGLSRRCLQNPDFRVPEDAVRELLEVSAAAAGIDDFGLRLAEKRQAGKSRPAGVTRSRLTHRSPGDRSLDSK